MKKLKRKIVVVALQDNKRMATHKTTIINKGLIQGSLREIEMLLVLQTSLQQRLKLTKTMAVVSHRVSHKHNLAIP